MRELLKDLDSRLLFITLFLLIIGLMTVYSATFNSEALLFKKQIIWKISEYQRQIKKDIFLY